jgi:hypothetical protein
MFSDVEPRLQWLLNGFLFFNLLHLVAIWGLGYLNERKQNAQRQEAVQDEETDDDDERRDASPATERRPSSPEVRSRSPNDRRSPSHDRTLSPLLRPRDDFSSVYQSYGTHPLPPPKSSSSPVQDIRKATSAAEVRRGKLFASMSAATVVFAWVLFLITSFIKIRSRREREGQT